MNEKREPGREGNWLGVGVIAGLLVAGFAAGEILGLERRRTVRRPPIESVPRTIVIGDDFREGQRGWITGFADYSPVSEGLDLDAGLRPLPAELGVEGTGLMITGNNLSDDLFMFLSKRLGPSNGIFPDQPYEVRFMITFASNVGEHCGGIGGSPGESVYLKAGASGEEPEVVLDPLDDHYRMTVDIGSQAEGGAAASVVGNIVNGTMNCFEGAPFVTVSRSHLHTSIVMSDHKGELWLLIGTDSGFEGRTTLYYQSVSAMSIPVGPDF
jgi:hypothetical protein